METRTSLRSLTYHILCIYSDPSPNVTHHEFWRFMCWSVSGFCSSSTSSGQNKNMIYRKCEGVSEMKWTGHLVFKKQLLRFIQQIGNISLLRCSHDPTSRRPRSLTGGFGGGCCFGSCGFGGFCGGFGGGGGGCGGFGWGVHVDVSDTAEINCIIIIIMILLFITTCTGPSLSPNPVMTVFSTPPPPPTT